MGFKVILSFVIVVLLISLYFLFTRNLYWDDVSQFHIVNSSHVFVDSYVLTAIRFMMGSVIWITCINLLTDKNGLNIVILGRDKKPIHRNIKHFERFTTFTIWSWSIQGLYFLLSILLYFNSYNLYASNLLVKITWILFQLSFSLSFLVSCVVTYVLLPTLIKTKQPIDTFFQITALLSHNANVIFMAIELILNRIPIYLSHIPFVLLFGVCYVVFSWYWFKVKGIFYYFFLDYEAKNALLWQIGLMTVLMIFYSLGWLLSSLKTQYPLLSSLIILSLAFSVTKVKV